MSGGESVYVQLWTKRVLMLSEVRNAWKLIEHGNGIVLAVAGYDPADFLLIARKDIDFAEILQAIGEFLEKFMKKRQAETKEACG